MVWFFDTRTVVPSTWDALYDTYWGIRDNVPIPEVPPTTGHIEYIVRAGDTLWLLAQRFNTTVAAIKSLNNLTSDALSIGQVLRIPTTGATTPSFTYTVKPGDTIWFLAQRFNTTVNDIRALNNLTSDVLSIGQTLQIPGSVISHTVSPGDTLWLIAQRFNTTVAAIRAVNNLTSDALHIGQILLIM